MERFVSELKVKQEEVRTEMLALASSSANNAVTIMGNDTPDVDPVDVIWLRVGDVTEDGGGMRWCPAKGIYSGHVQPP